MRVLLTNIAVSGHTGTEIVLRDIALGLLHGGHQPVVYTPHAGPLAESLRAASVPVVDHIAAIGLAPDVIHGHHNVPLATAVARFPEVPAIFVCHDFIAWHDSPPDFPSIRRYVAVDLTVADRLRLESGIPPARVEVLYNAVDLERFPVPVRELPNRPKRALAFVKHTRHVEEISSACAARGIWLDVVGTVVRKPLDEPETALPQYDLVFTSALSALEAMASGCGVIVCDARGLAGFVTLEAFERWRPYNFGLRTLRQRVTADTLGAEIDRYDRAVAASVTARIREVAGMHDLVGRYVALYEECVAEGVPAPPAEHDLAVARFLEQWGPRSDARWPWMIERRRLSDDLDAALDRPARLRSGDTIVLMNGGSGPIEFLSGFSRPEEHGVWTDGETANILLRFETADAVELEFQVDAFVRDQHPRLDVDVFANGESITNWSFDHPYSPEPWYAVVKPSGAGTVLLTFVMRTPSSPSAIGESSDSRQLGIALRQLSVVIDAPA